MAGGGGMSHQCGWGGCPISVAGGGMAHQCGWGGGCPISVAGCIKPHSESCGKGRFTGGIF